MAEGDGAIMFDTRIKEDCRLNTFLKVLIEEKADNWKKIAAGIKGKDGFNRIF